MGGAHSASKWDSLSETDKAQVDQQIVVFLERALLKYQEATLTINIIRAFGLARTESSDYGTCNPYVECYIKGRDSVTVKTVSKADTTHPSWQKDEGALVLEEVCGMDDLVLVVYDDETLRNGATDQNSCDILGTATIPLQGLHSGDRPITTNLVDGEHKNHNGNFGEITVRWKRNIAMPRIEPGSSRETVEKEFFALIAKKHEQQVREELEAEVVALLEKFISINPAAPPSAPTQSNADPLVSDQVESSTLSASDEMGVPSNSSATGVPEEPPRVRKEIRTMNSLEQQRFVDAILTMMQKKHDDQPESEWFRLASYHGWPANDSEGYCAHRAEHFPGWHRAYLLAMERALGEADKLNGNDGRLALPYWDFSRVEIRGEVMPAAIRMDFGEKFHFPVDFFDSVEDSSNSALRFMRLAFSRLSSEAKLKQMLESGNVARDAVACLDQWANHEHWLFASTENSRGTPLEQSHNMVHNALGFPLTSLRYAAFHPMFWLLHCNVDRLFASYVQNTAGRAAECIAEMRQHQKLASQRGLTDLSIQPLEPFKAPDGSPYLMEHMFETRPLGYMYDQLVRPPAPQLRAPPTYVLFRNVDVVRNMIDRDGHLKSFSLHVFLIPHSLPRGSVGVPVDGKAEHYHKNPYYAGVSAAFGGKGPRCKNCAETQPVHIKLDVSSKLAQLGVQCRQDVDVRVIAEDEVGAVVALDLLSTTYGPSCKIALPLLVGPLFEASSPDIVKDPTKKNSYCLQLQRYLKKFGYYTGPLDGMFGDGTETALKLYQEVNGLLSDGVAGDITKSRMITPLHDGHKHVQVQAHRSDSSGDVAAYAKGSAVKYWIGASPGYLARGAVEDCIAAALQEWSSSAQLSFSQVQTEQEVGDMGMKFVFGFPSETDTGLDRREGGGGGAEEDNELTMNIANFDGPGGELARCEGVTVRFDIAERWALTASDCSSPAHFNLRAVALHEVGHALGLSHSSDPLSVMSPYYSVNRIALAVDDKSRISVLYT